MTQRIEPAAGQESVWDYPRPPRVEATSRLVRVEAHGREIVRSSSCVRVLETSHPPVYYVPRQDVAEGVLVSTATRTYCEFKGVASYVGLTDSDRDVGWFYADPAPGYEVLRDMIAFYPSRVDACYLDDDRVQAQAGDFYGGWITPEVVGPFKGGPGTRGW